MSYKQLFWFIFPFCRISVEEKSLRWGMLEDVPETFQHWAEVLREKLLSYQRQADDRCNFCPRGKCIRVRLFISCVGNFSVCSWKDQEVCCCLNPYHKPSTKYWNICLRQETTVWKKFEVKPDLCKYLFLSNIHSRKWIHSNLILATGGSCNLLYSQETSKQLPNRFSIPFGIW